MMAGFPDNLNDPASALPSRDFPPKPAFSTPHSIREGMQCCAGDAVNQVGLGLVVGTQ